MNIKLIFRPGSLWIGAHWSAQNRQWCVNLIPCVTLRIRFARKQKELEDCNVQPGQIWTDGPGREYVVKGISWDGNDNGSIVVTYVSIGIPSVRCTTTFSSWRRRFSRVS